MTCFSLHFDELKLKVQNKFAPMMGLGWTQLQAEGGKRTLLCSSLLWESPGHEVTQGGDCDTRPQGGGAVRSGLIQVESFDKFQSRGFTGLRLSEFAQISDFFQF